MTMVTLLTGQRACGPMASCRSLGSPKSYNQSLLIVLQAHRHAWAVSFGRRLINTEAQSECIRLKVGPTALLTPEKPGVGCIQSVI